MLTEKIADIKQGFIAQAGKLAPVDWARIRPYVERLEKLENELRQQEQKQEVAA